MAGLKNGLNDNRGFKQNRNPAQGMGIGDLSCTIIAPSIESIDSEFIVFIVIAFRPKAGKNRLAFSAKILLLAAFLFLTGCTYNVILEPHPTVENTALPISADIVIPVQTARYTYDVKSVTAGAANTFRIEVGSALVQYAESFLKPVFEQGNDVSIEIIILGFNVHDFEAHINAQFVVTKDKEIVFEKGYQASGQGYYARTFWGGAFAMKSSMRNTTREALNLLFTQFLSDAELEYKNWLEIEDEF